jgi:hypothetical protein
MLPKAFKNVSLSLLPVIKYITSAGSFASMGRQMLFACNDTSIVKVSHLIVGVVVLIKCGSLSLERE